MTQTLWITLLSGDIRVIVHVSLRCQKASSSQAQPITASDNGLKGRGGSKAWHGSLKLPTPILPFSVDSMAIYQTPEDAKTSESTFLPSGSLFKGEGRGWSPCLAILQGYLTRLSYILFQKEYEQSFWRGARYVSLQDNDRDDSWNKN